MQGTSVSIPLYLGVGDEGIKLKERINAVVAQRKAIGSIHSLSALVREYIETGLAADERKNKNKRAVAA